MITIKVLVEFGKDHSTKNDRHIPIAAAQLKVNVIVITLHSAGG